MGKKKNKTRLPEPTHPRNGAIAQEQQHHETAALCRESPGEWFSLYATKTAAAYSSASRWRAGKRPKAYQGPGWQFGHTRTTDPKMRELYVRFVGEGA